MKKYRIAYCTPSLYIAGGIERVITTKANYFAEILGYDIYIILTDGKDKKPYYRLSSKIHIIQLDIKFEELWSLSFLKKIPIYLKKQREYKKKLKETLFKIKPDITVSLLRREINFINDINDGSYKFGELHVTRDHYRNFETNKNSFFKKMFSKFWISDLLVNLKKLDAFIVLNDEEKKKWAEIKNVHAIPNPLPFNPQSISNLKSKEVIAVGRYEYQKGFDILLKAWKIIVEKHPDWKLKIYGSGNREPYINLCKDLDISNTCEINGADNNTESRYCESSIYALSSRYEGFGMVIIEAMACGVPVVAFSSSSGPRGIIKNNVNGFLIDDFNIEKMADKISYLMDNYSERIRIQNEGINTSKEYSIEKIADKWVGLFNSLN